jgi:CRP-like cAMP-binding protein
VSLRKFPAGALIIMAGDPAKEAFLIHEGTVEQLSSSNRPGQFQAELGPGEVFGEMSLIDERPHEMSVRAVTPVRVSMLKRAEFEQALSVVPEDHSVFLKTIFERLRMATSQSVAVSPQLVAVPPQSVTVSPGNIITQTTALSFNKKPVATKISVTIYPLSHRAAEELPRDGFQIVKFPFRIGRTDFENESHPQDINDLSINDEQPYNVSRNHALIQMNNGEVLIRDRGSSRGIYVNEVHIGGKSSHREMVLEDGDNIVVLGGSYSPYQFRIHIDR